MEIQLKELIDQIKNDGIKTAQEKAQEVKAQAEEKAKQILLDAEKEARQIAESAKLQAKKFEEASIETVKQAGRDFILNIEKQIIQIFNSLVKQEAKTALSSRVLEQVLVSVLSNWKPDTENTLSLLLPQAMQKELESFLYTKLSKEIKTGITIKPLPGLDAGFQIKEEAGALVHDFSYETMAKLLAEHLNPHLAKIIKESR